MRYGHFDDDNREYVITQPDTPLPWINYLGSQDFIGIISNTAGGYAFFRDARLRRLTRYRYNNVPADAGGRYLYVRDDESGEYWSPTWQPTQTALTAYECRHGLGYTKIRSSYQGIQASITYFVPLRETLEIWHLDLTNSNRTPVRLSVFSCVEFCLWDAQDDATNFQRNFSIGEVEVEDGTIYHKTEYRERRDHFAYFACSETPSGFDTQREAFLGPYRGWDRPLAVERGASSNSIAHGWAPIGSHHVELALAPGASRQVVFVLGYQENPREQKFDPPSSQNLNKRFVATTINKFLQPSNVATALEDLEEHWDGLTGAMQVHTPDEHTNRIVNFWNPYQNMATFSVSRSASLFESGVNRGIGFRDSAQDLLGFVHMVPARSRQRLLDLAATQLETGGAYHQYQPLTKRGNDAVGSGFNDDPLWLILSTAAYLKETGDWTILDEMVPYDNHSGTETALYEHLERSLHYTQDNLGPHGLPLIGRADWNDCLNLNTFSEEPGESFQTAGIQEGKIAESVVIGAMFVQAANELAEIATRIGKTDAASTQRDASAAMEGVVLSHGWDGDWFLRAYDGCGDKVGSRVCAEGQIYIEPQGFCAMAGVGLADDKAKRALEAVRERLATRHGIVLLQPAYSRYYLHLGEISSYPPGYKENASVFCHTNPWIMIAEAMIGNGDQAFDYYSRINPSAREELGDVHRCEPYVYAQMIAGPDAPTFGEAKNSWLTGTAAWNYVAITQWILGITPTHDGLRIAPVIPKDWPGFSATRLFRGVTYRIAVERQGTGNTVRLSADGEPVEGDVVPVPDGPKTAVSVVAVLV
jgi:cellobiose phosphorylase